MPKIRSTNPYINKFKTLENYTNFITVDKNGAGDYKTFQAAINSINDATEQNKYIIVGYAGGVHEEKVVLDKDHIKLTFENNLILISDQAPVLTITNNNETHEGLFVQSNNSTINLDNVYVYGGCSPSFSRCVFNSTLGTFALRTNNSNVSLLNVNCIAVYDSIKVENSSVLTYHSGVVKSGVNRKDFIADPLTVIRFGVVDYNKSKIEILGSLNPIITSDNIGYDNLTSKIYGDPDTVQKAIEYLARYSVNGKNIGQGETPYPVKPEDNIIYIDSSLTTIGCYLPLASEVINKTYEFYASNYNFQQFVYTQPSDKIIVENQPNKNISELLMQYSALKLKAIENNAYNLECSSGVIFN